MPKVKHHDPSIDTNIRLLIEKGYTAREIAAESGKSPMTIYDYASDLGLKFKKGKQHHDKDLSPKDPNAPPEDPKPINQTLRSRFKRISQRSM
ncbi:MAG: TetR/AcrR family transcriptional regulator [Candidatus Thermoplasmatota archaeon]|nr:TetR/AcrR family transcriptional regulator [Candidatus Thermoplasmatota archaeon]